MSNFKSLATMVAAATVLPSALGAFDASSNSNMAVYWGQGPNQKPLSHFCADPNIDIINIGFLNQFPDQTKGYPGTNFGNQCGDATYTNKDKTKSPFLSDCPSIGPDIVTCQAAGKKVFLSLGGAIPSNQSIKNDDSALAFAQTLWTSFGPKTDATAPRPFGDAVIDGFDLDIESVLVPGESVGDLSMGYSSLVNDLRALFLSYPAKQFFITGAPQCIVPDAHLSDAIETSFFDFLFVQFYNTPECSARAYFDHNYGGAGTNISFSKWVDFVHTAGLNKKTKVFLGLPASNDANVVYTPDMYLNPDEAKEIIQAFQSQYPEDFGGVMLYEATASETNSINGVPYADVLKKDLKGDNLQSSTSSAAGFPTIVPSSLPFGLAPPSSSGAPFPFPTGLAPSSSAPYPTSSGSSPYFGPTGSSTGVVPSGSVSSKAGTASYTIKTGTAPYSKKTGTAPYSSKTGTAPYTKKTGTAPYSIKTGTAGSASATSSAASSASSGSLPSGSASSNAPYPVSNTSLPFSTGGYSSPSTTGEEVVTKTDVVTITSCGPEVTNCPAKTHPIVSTETYLSTIRGSSSASAPVGGSSASSSGSLPTGGAGGASGASSVSSSVSVPAGGSVPTTGSGGAGGASGASSVTSAPINSPQSTQDVVTTEIVTSYVTTCPVTSTATSGGSQIIETGLTTSTVYSTIISTICTKCVAPPTPAPTKGTSPSGPVSQSQSPLTTSAAASSASTQEVVTTVVQYTTLTTCPVTNTITSGTSQIVLVTQSVSTITSTFISTICTKCVAPPTSVPAPGSGSNTPPSTATAGIPGSGHQGPPLPMPAGPSPVSSSPVNFSPGNSSPGNSSPAGSSSVVVSSSPVPSNSGNTGSSGSSPVPSIPSSPAGSSSTPIIAQSPSSTPAVQPAGGNTPSNSGTGSNTQGSSKPAAPVVQSPPAGSSSSSSPPVPAISSPAGPKTIQSTINLIPIQTLTIVPIPANPSQTASPSKKPIESAEQQANNPASAGGSSSGKSSPAGSSGAPSPPPPSSGSSGAPANSPVSGNGPVPFFSAPSNGTTTPTVISSATSPGSSGTGSPKTQSSVVAFKGAASRTDTPAGIYGAMIAIVAAGVLIL